MPNRAWVSRVPNAAFERAPQRADRRMARRGRRLLGRPGDALVQLHDDVGAQQVGLDLHRALGREHVREPSMWLWKVTASSVTLEIFDSDMTWKPPLSVRIGLVPAHEAVQAAQPRHPLGGRAQHQVVGVAQHDVGAGLGHLVDGQRLDRAGGADRHEGGRADVAARGLQHAGAGRAVGGGDGRRERRPSGSASDSFPEQAAVAIGIEAVARGDRVFVGRTASSPGRRRPRPA
jgi:hypothetical protein